jgi:hypothetical protein
MSVTGSLPFPARGVRLWVALFAGIGLWMVHLTACAALAAYACRHPHVHWVMHGLTATTAAATGIAIYWSGQFARHGYGADEEDAGAAGRARFLGRFGVITGVASLVLIVAEGLYVPFLAGCR